MPLKRALLSLALALVSGLALQAVTAAARDDDDWPAWVDEEEALRQRIAEVNEGELAFLDKGTERAVHHHDSRILITESSLRDGWVVMEQCHQDLDRVPAAQIVFNPERSRALEVLSYRNMEAAFAEANTVQLRGIGDASQICLRAETRALHSDGVDVFELHNGPFMRRFLDGYYPLRLSMRIDYPASLRLADHVPEIQPGFAVSQAPGRVDVEAVFEGRLHTRFRFLRD